MQSCGILGFKEPDSSDDLRLEECDFSGSIFEDTRRAVDSGLTSKAAGPEQDDVRLSSQGLKT